MTDKDIDKRIAVLFKQLEVMDFLEDEFMEKLGVSGYWEKVNLILDEINFLRREKEKRKSNKK